MSDTPWSETYPGGLSPGAVVDLDDHRFQPQHMPRANTVESSQRPRSRRGTAGSVVERPDMTLFSPSETQAIQWDGVRVRNFPENAIDDTKSINSQDGGRSARHGSLAGRRSTFRRAAEHSDAANRSRPSSTSSRSISPPNSVEAFAESRRRDRSNTVRSRPSSDIDLPHLSRTVSGGTHRRRPTLSDDRSATQSVVSRHSSAEEDVCYPQEEEEGNAEDIDFDDLDEFIAEERERQAAERALRSPVINGVPKIITTAATPDGRTIDDPLEEKQDLDEPEVVDLPVQAPSVVESTGTMNPKPFWTFFSSDLEDTIYAPTLGGLLSDGETSRDLFHLQSPDHDGVWWLDMLNPSEDAVTVICKAFGIHPLTREDITTQEMREKVELFRTYYFVCFRSFYQMDKNSESFLEPVNVYLVVFRQGILTFSFCQNPHATNVRRRIGRLRDYMQLSADWICYALIDDIVDSFGPVIHDIELSTDRIEDEVFTARAEDSRTVLRAIGDARKTVMSLIRLLGGKADVIKGFAKRCNENYSVAPRGDVGMYLSDIQDHVVTMMGNLGHFEKMLSRSHANYLAQVSIDNLALGNQSQASLGKVTLIATILVPLNLITGLFGMNVKVPGGGGSTLIWWFSIVGVIAAFVIGCLIWAKKKRLI